MKNKIVVKYGVPFAPYKKQIEPKTLEGFVPYEESLELKKLGFDIDKHHGAYIKFIGDEEMCYDPLDWANYKFWGGRDFEVICKTPMYQQAFDWFREEHGLDSYIETTSFKGEKIYAVTVKDWNDEDPENWETWGRRPYDDHDEAKLECLQKLIEIVQTKQY